MPIWMSWSRFESYETCKLQYVLRYEKRIRKLKPRMVFLVGSVVHNVIKKWHESGFQAKHIENNIIQVFNEEAKSLRFKDAQTRAITLKKAVRGALLAERIYRLLKIPEHLAQVEEWFNLSFPGGQRDRLVGGTDVYDREEGGVIYDLKMYSDANHGDKRQVMTYALAKRIQGQPVGRIGFITPFLATKVRTERITEDDIKGHLSVLTEALQHMRAGVTPTPTPGQACYFCEFRNTPLCSATYRPSESMSIPGQRHSGTGRRLRK